MKQWTINDENIFFLLISCKEYSNVEPTNKHKHHQRRVSFKNWPAYVLCSCFCQMSLMWWMIGFILDSLMSEEMESCKMSNSIEFDRVTWNDPINICLPKHNVTFIWRSSNHPTRNEEMRNVFMSCLYFYILSIL